MDLQGNQLRITLKIFIDSALDPANYNVFVLQAGPIIKQHWEDKFGFECSNPAYPLTYRPIFDIVFVQDAGEAHWAMYMSEGTTPAVSRNPHYATRNLPNAPTKVAMRPDSATDVQTTLGRDIIGSIKDSFPFYADFGGGALSRNAENELKLLVRQIARADASSVLSVTAYGSNRATMQDQVISLLKAAGLNNIIKRRSKKVLRASSPKTGSRNYTKILLESGLGTADTSGDPLFRYPATIVHEFGHMIGLVDEYACFSQQAADKMAELGFIHASETNQFKEYGSRSGEAAPESQKAQATLTEWAHANDCEPAQYGTKTVSIMSNGSEFYKRHYLTLWKAIADYTQGTTQPDEWSIVPLN